MISAQRSGYTHIAAATCRLHGSAGALISIGLLKSVDLGFLQLCLQSLKESAGGAHLQAASGACPALLCS